MADSDPLHAGKDDAPPSTLAALHLRLLADGADWRAEFPPDDEFFRRVEEFGEMARQGELAAAHGRAVARGMRMRDRGEMRMRETNTQDAAPDPQASPPRHTPYPGASARWVGSIAALLIVAVLAGLFLAQRGHKSPLAQPTATTGSQRACASSEITASLPARSYLMDLAMTGPDSGWAVGSVQDEGLPPFNSHVLIAQFRQCRWQPLDLTFPHAALTSITMISPREGWAAGWSEENGPLLLHYQDGAWSRVTPPEGGQAPAGARRAYGAVSSLATGDVWLVELTVWQDKQGNGWGFNTLLHLASSRWTRISVSEDSVLALAPVGGDDIWLLGTVTNATGQRLAHYRGGTLVSATPFTQDGAHLSHLRMFAPNDGWATGSAEETRGGLVYSRPVALHYDGARWTQTETGHRMTLKMWSWSPQVRHGPTRRSQRRRILQQAVLSPRSAARRVTLRVLRSLLRLRWRRRAVHICVSSPRSVSARATGKRSPSPVAQPLKALILRTSPVRVLTSAGRLE